MENGVESNQRHRPALSGTGKNMEHCTIRLLAGTTTAGISSQTYRSLSCKLRITGVFRKAIARLSQNTEGLFPF
jgi:hypothetical protein